MLCKKIVLRKPYEFVEIVEDLQLEENHIIVKPTYLSICAADLRYYTGSRGLEVLKEKLPMALIHEAIGIVVYDPTNEYDEGDRVVLIPNVINKDGLKYRENYDPSSTFKSSSEDGFMSEYISIKKSRVILTGDINYKSASMLELLSVVFSALEDMEKILTDGDTIGLWGNGNLGYLTSLVLKNQYPNSSILLIGRSHEKNEFFRHVKHRYTTSDLEREIRIDHAFECVGGEGSESAINQIISHINPQGHISLLGVSEISPRINTRLVLEKGLTLHGSSRSNYKDFERAVKLLEENKNIALEVSRLVSEEIEVKHYKDVKTAFDKSITNQFKTIMKWEI